MDYYPVVPSEPEWGQQSVLVQALPALRKLLVRKSLWMVSECWLVAFQSCLSFPVFWFSLVFS